MNPQQEKFRDAIQQSVDLFGLQNARRVMNAMVIAYVVWVALVVAGIIVVVGGPVAWVAIGVGGMMLLGVPQGFRYIDSEFDRLKK